MSKLIQYRLVISDLHFFGTSPLHLYEKKFAPIFFSSFTKFLYIFAAFQFFCGFPVYCAKIKFRVNFGHLTINLTSDTLVRRSRSKILFFLIEYGHIVGGWSYNVILKYAYLSHKMQYSMLGDDIFRFYQNFTKRGGAIGSKMFFF